MPRRAPAVSLAFLLLMAAAAAQNDDREKVHIRMHKKIAPSVVYVTGGGQAGSGVCIDKEGIILTSPSACGTATDAVTVLGTGSRQYSGRVIGRNNDKELVLVKIDASLPAVEFADSDQAKIGQVTYVLGDSYDSIKIDDQVAISLGVVSGVYDVTKKQRGAYYTGPVIETSAAVNPNQDGGPMVNADGKLLGIVTLNYEESRFTGIAVPINQLKTEIAQLIKAWKNPATVVKSDPKTAGGWLGASIEEVDETGIKIKRVTANGPADKAGLKAGDVIVKIDSRRVLTTKLFNELMAKVEAGAKVQIRIERDGKEQTITVTLGKRNEY